MSVPVVINGLTASQRVEFIFSSMKDFAVTASKVLYYTVPFSLRSAPGYLVIASSTDSAQTRTWREKSGTLLSL